MSTAPLTYPATLRLWTLQLLAGDSFTDATSDQRWHITDHSRVIGYGEPALRAATYRLLSWQAHAHAGVGGENKTRPRATHGERKLPTERQAQPEEGDVVELRFGPTVSPCEILYLERTATRTVLVYGTLPGHVERGEEAFVIELHGDGSVTARCIAFSQHAWWLAKLGAPVARWVQKRETRLYVDGMRPRVAQRLTHRDGS